MELRKRSIRTIVAVILGSSAIANSQKPPFSQNRWVQYLEVGLSPKNFLRHEIVLQLVHPPLLFRIPITNHLFLSVTSSTPLSTVHSLSIPSAFLSQIFSTSSPASIKALSS